MLNVGLFRFVDVCSLLILTDPVNNVSSKTLMNKDVISIIDFIVTFTFIVASILPGCCANSCWLVSKPCLGVSLSGGSHFMWFNSPSHAGCCDFFIVFVLKRNRRPSESTKR